MRDTKKALATKRWRSGQSGLRRSALAALCSLSLGLSSVASAQPLDNVSREAATALAVAGLEAYEAGSYADALDKLEKAYAVARVPTLGLWSARTLYKLGRWREAEDRYRETLGLPLPEGDRATQQQALVDAKTELEALSPTIPSVNVEVEGARLEDIELQIDGKPAPDEGAVQRLDPGSHHIEGVRGDSHQSVNLTLGPGERQSIVLRFNPQTSAVAAEPALDGHGSSWLRPAGWTAVALGGAGIAAGTVGLVLAIGKKNDIDRSTNCQGNTCNAAEQDLVDSYNSNRQLANIGLIAGGVLAAAGVGALVIGGRSSGDPRAEAVFSPAFTGVRGSF